MNISNGEDYPKHMIFRPTLEVLNFHDKIGMRQTRLFDDSLVDMTRKEVPAVPPEKEKKKKEKKKKHQQE